MPQEHVEQVIVLMHDQGEKPCGGVAQRVTLSWLANVAAGVAPLVCMACLKKGRGARATLTLDQVTGDEPYVPVYQPPGRRVVTA